MSEGRPAMDKSAASAVRPGPGSGVVKSYNAKRNPFGGFITDDATGADVFVHKSAVEKAGLGKLQSGQRLTYEVVADGFGAYKAERLASAD